MKDIKHYLDECISSGRCTNDREIADELKVTKQAISSWRRGISAPNDEQAINLARLVRKPEIELMAEAAAARAKTPEARKYWEKIAKYSATVASVGAIVISSLCVTYPTESRASSTHAPTPIFIMLSWIAMRIIKRQRQLAAMKRHFSLKSSTPTSLGWIC
jgi:transcriptional regulator with XRE-family HTH domain